MATENKAAENQRQDKLVDACAARTAFDYFRKRHDAEAGSVDLSSFIKHHTINYKPLKASVHPFDQLPVEILFHVLKHVANHNLRLETGVLSPHIFKARRIQRRVAVAVDHLLRDKARHGLRLSVPVPTTYRQLKNFLAASENKALCTLTEELYLPVELQTACLETVVAWSATFGARYGRQYSPWALKPRPYRDHVYRLMQSRYAQNILDTNCALVGCFLARLVNLRSLKIRTIPSPPPRDYWEEGPSLCDKDTPFLANNYAHVATLLDILSAAQIIVQDLTFIGIGPALLEPSFLQRFDTWSVLEHVTKLQLTLVEGEDLEFIDKDLLVRFFPKFHALRTLELTGNTIHRDFDSEEYCVEQILEIFLVRPRPFLRRLSLRLVSCWAWTLRKVIEDHEETLAEIHLEDVNLFQPSWYTLMRCLRERVLRGKPWEKVCVINSHDMCRFFRSHFYDEDEEDEMRKIVEEYGISLASYFDISRYAIDIGKDDDDSESE